MPVVSSSWFCETLEERTGFAIRVRSKLLETVSDFQKIEVFDSEVMGRVLILDGCFMVTETDHFIYHEMLVHPAMAIVPRVRKALIIGGGDGGAVTEMVKYPQVESITLCEIDPMVVSVCRQYFPEVSTGLNDPRVRIIHEDGAAYVRDTHNTYDIIVVDSTDPVGPGTALFESRFYRSVKKCLADDGAAIFQTENPMFMSDVFSMVVWDLMDVFGPDRARPYLATVPSYPGGLWSFALCSRNRDPLEEPPTEVPPGVSSRLRYYDRQVHKAAFALPVFVRMLLENR